VARCPGLLNQKLNKRLPKLGGHSLLKANVGGRRKSGGTYVWGEKGQLPYGIYRIRLVSGTADKGRS